MTLFPLDEFAWFHEGTITDHWGKAAVSLSYKMCGNTLSAPSCVWHLFLYSLMLGNPGKMIEVVYGALLWSSDHSRKAQVRPKGFVMGKLGLSGPACLASASQLELLYNRLSDATVPSLTLFEQECSGAFREKTKFRCMGKSEAVENRTDPPLEGKLILNPSIAPNNTK